MTAPRKVLFFTANLIKMGQNKRRKIVHAADNDQQFISTRRGWIDQGKKVLKLVFVY